MRTLFKYITLFLTLLIVACQNEVEDNQLEDLDVQSNSVVVQDGVITGPKWMVEVIDSISKRHGKIKTPTIVYTISHENKLFYEFIDLLDDTIEPNFFNKEGIRLNNNTMLYQELDNSTDKNLLWSTASSKTSFETRASSSGTTVVTPRGSLVPNVVTYSDVWTTNEEAIEQSFLTRYPYAVKVGEHSKSYNCHSYAWNVSEGGPQVWINDINNSISIYWTDRSYMSTSQSNATKVYYYNGDHSAVTTSVQDVFISKWGSYALMKHDKAHCPYYNGSTLQYYCRDTRPDYYIGINGSDYSQSHNTYAYDGYSGISLYAYSLASTPNRYEWSAEFYGDCNRYYIWPNGYRADISVYFDNMNYGGQMRITCNMYNDNTLLGTGFYYLWVYNSQQNNARENDEESTENSSEGHEAVE